MTSIKNSSSFLEKISFWLRIFYEKLTDVDFTKVIPVEDLGLDSKIVSKCSPTTVKYLYKVLDYLKINTTRILWFNKGSLLQDGNPTSILEAYKGFLDSNV